MRRLLTMLGRRTRRVFALIGFLLRLNLALGRKALLLPRLNLRLIGKITVNQIRFGGLQAAPLVAGIAALVGGIAIAQSFNLLTAVADDLIGAILVGIVVREVGPLVVAVVLIGRSGTAMATELGSMRLNGELDALRAYRIDPLDFVVLPRVIGMIVSLFCLLALFDVAGLLGGFAISTLMSDLSFALLRGRVTAALTNADIGLSALKAVVFGYSIALFCCHFGLRVRRSPTELPQAVTKAVVAALAGVVVLDGALVAAFYLS